MPTANCPRCGQPLRLADGAKSFRCPVCSAAISIRPRQPAAAVDDGAVLAQLAVPTRREKRSPWPWIIIGAVLLLFLAVPVGFMIAINMEPWAEKGAPPPRPPAAQAVGSVVLGLLGVMGGIVVYFVPGIVAECRQHQNTLAIFMLNLLLGWTFVGWCVAMVWACTEVRGGAR